MRRLVQRLELGPLRFEVSMDREFGVEGLESLLAAPRPDPAPRRTGLATGAPYCFEVQPTAAAPHAEELPGGGGPRLSSAGTSIVAEVLGAAGRCDLNTRLIRVQANDARSVWAVARLFSALLLPSEGGLVLHASAVLRDGRLHIFAGPSGAGKTTVTRLSSELGFEVLAEENFLIGVQEGRPWAAQSPLFPTRGGLDTEVRSPVGVYFIRHAERDELRALSPEAATRKIVENSIIRTTGLAPEHRAAILSDLLKVATDLALAVPCHDLGFRPQASFWEVLR